MRLWLRNHGRIAVTVILAFATLTGGVGWAWPDARLALGTHPGWGWTIAVVAVAVAVILWLDDDRAVAECKTELFAKDEAHKQAVAALELELARGSAAIADLESRLHPTDRDRALFSELMNAWPWESGTLPWLNYGFNAHRWEGARVEHLYDFVAVWAERFFDDSVMQDAFLEFYEVCAALVNWMSSHGSPERQTPPRSLEQGFVYSIADGHERLGGWPEMDRLRDAALAYVQRIFNLRRPLEATGRQRGL